MIKHLKPRSETEIQMIHLKTNAIFIFKRIILGIITSPLAIICLILSCIIACISVPIMFPIAIYKWAKEDNRQEVTYRSFDFSEFRTEFWRIPGQPICWFLEKIWDIDNIPISEFWDNNFGIH